MCGEPTPAPLQTLSRHRPTCDGLAHAARRRAQSIHIKGSKVRAKEPHAHIHTATHTCDGLAHAARTFHTDLVVTGPHTHQRPFLEAHLTPVSTVTESRRGVCTCTHFGCVHGWRGELQNLKLKPMPASASPVNLHVALPHPPSTHTHTHTRTPPPPFTTISTPPPHTHTLTLRPAAAQTQGWAPPADAVAACSPPS